MRAQLLLKLSQALQSGKHIAQVCTSTTLVAMVSVPLRLMKPLHLTLFVRVFSLNYSTIAWAQIHTVLAYTTIRCTGAGFSTQRRVRIQEVSDNRCSLSFRGWLQFSSPNLSYIHHTNVTTIFGRPKPNASHNLSYKNVSYPLDLPN